jgi:hypothetical protein
LHLSPPEDAKLNTTADPLTIEQPHDIITLPIRSSSSARLTSPDYRPHLARHQSSQTLAEASIEVAGLPTTVDDHGQAGLLRCRPTADYGDGRAPVAQGIQQSRVALASTPASTRAGDAGSTGGRLTEFTAVFSAVRNLIVPPPLAALLLPSILIASMPWRNGRP